MVRGVALQPPDLHRITFPVEHDASALAQHFRRADPRAARAEDIRAENRAGRAGEIAVGDLLDEGGDVNARRAGLDAGRVEAKQAAARFDDGFLRSVGRSDSSAMLAAAASAPSFGLIGISEIAFSA